MTPYVLLSLILALLATGNVQAAAFEARVIAVLDGDTLLVTQGGKPVKLRLAEIDAPEVGHDGRGGGSSRLQPDQPYGAEARKSLADMVMGRQVHVERRAVDVYGRIVAVVSVAGLDVNREQVRRGYAWAATGWRQSRRASVGAPPAGDSPRSHAHELMALQHEAQAARRGLWASAGNIEPAQWRKLHSSSDAARPVPAASQVAACGRKYCAEFSSCAEAKRYFVRCGGKQLDGDGDGKPCESLCVGGMKR